MPPSFDLFLVPIMKIIELIQFREIIGARVEHYTRHPSYGEMLILLTLLQSLVPTAI